MNTSLGVYYGGLIRRSKNKRKSKKQSKKYSKKRSSTRRKN
jgi:hypothetical protein